jgi:hypothetical protein
LEWAALIGGGVFGLCGVWLGWKLNQKTAREAAWVEREWVEGQRVREREESAAAQLDQALADAMADLPQLQGPIDEITDRLGQFRVQLLHAWQLATVLDDADITSRLNALDMAIFIQTQDARHLRVRHWGESDKPVTPTVNPWPLEVATREVRMALAAFQRRETAPPATFPTAKELVQLANEGGRDDGLQRVADLLVERGARA